MFDSVTCVLKMVAVLYKLDLATEEELNEFYDIWNSENGKISLHTPNFPFNGYLDD